MKNRLIQSLLLTIAVLLIICVGLQYLEVSFFSFDSRFTLYNDEVFYYNQIQSVLHGGAPKGFFGYNESTAYIGNFGAWSNIIIYFYSLFCLPFMWSINMVYYANILMLCTGMFMFFLLNNKDIKQNLVYLAIFISIFFCRYIFSGMVEVMFYVAVILVMLYLINNTNLNKYIAIIAICIASLGRVYFVAFIPIVILYNNKINFKKITCSIILMFSMAFISLLYSNLFTAEYLSPLVRTNEIINALFRQNLSLSIKGIGRFILENLKAVQWIVKSYSFNYDMSGLIYITYFFTLLLLLINLFMNLLKHRNIKQSVLVLLLYFGIFIIVINLYYPNQGGRHLLIFILMAWFFLLSENLRLIYSIVIVVFCVLTSFNFTKNAINLYEVRSYSIEDYARDFEIVEIDDTSNSWENTLLFEYGVDNELHNFLFHLQPGIGINLCMADFLAMNAENVRAKYIMLAIDSDNIELYRGLFEIISSNDRFVIMRRK